MQIRAEQLTPAQAQPAAEDRRYGAERVAEQRAAERTPAAEHRSEQHAGPGRVARQRVRDDKRAGTVSDQHRLPRQTGRHLYDVVHVRPQIRLTGRGAVAVAAQAHRVRREAALRRVLEPVLLEDPGGVARSPARTGSAAGARRRPIGR